MNKLLHRYRAKPFLQRGGKEGLDSHVAREEVSILGYKKDSPYIHEEYLFIETPNGKITMKDVPFPVLAISDLGEVEVMYPEREYQFRGKVIKEIPLRSKMRGGCIKKTKFSSGGTINGKSPQEYLDKINKENSIANSVVTGGAMVGSTIADIFLPGSGQIVGSAIKLIGSGAIHYANQARRKDIEKAKRIIAVNQYETAGRNYENTLKDALGYV